MHARCAHAGVVLAGLLEEREETVYKVAAGYSDKATSLFTLDLGPPQDLPDALRGESWMFVQVRRSACQLLPCSGPLHQTSTGPCSAACC